MKRTKPIKLTVAGESKKVKLKSSNWGCRLGGKRLAGMIPALFALPQAGREEGFWKLLFALSASVCLRAPHPGEAALTGSSHPPQERERGCREGGWACCLQMRPVLLTFIPSEAALMAAFYSTVQCVPEQAAVTCRGVVGADRPPGKEDSFFMWLSLVINWEGSPVSSLSCALYSGWRTSWGPGLLCLLLSGLTHVRPWGPAQAADSDYREELRPRIDGQCWLALSPGSSPVLLYQIIIHIFHVYI